MFTMKKYVTSMALLVLLAGCSETTEQPTPVEPTTTTPALAPTSPVNSAPTTTPEIEEPTTAEESPLATDENLDFDDDVSQFEGWIRQMATWQSYKAVLDNYDNYFDDDNNIDGEYHEQTEFVTQPFQYFQSTHSIGFANNHAERYIAENAETGVLEGVERYQMEEWQILEDVEYYAINIAPARADMLQAMIDLSQERLLSEDGQTLTVNVLPEKSKEAFSRLSMGVHFAVSEAELTDSIKEQLAMDESEIDRVAAVIYADGQAITGYSIDIYVGNDGEQDHYSYEERFSDINTLKDTTSPEDL
ncbi:MAG: hypothetical protein ABS948_07820 [Solibacillus sp.]